MTKKQKNSKSGFTMVEIIAVLVIIGIMAAVAAPKFINMGKVAKQKAAIAGTSEAKAMLSASYAKAYLTIADVSTDPVTVADVMEAAGVDDKGTVIFGDITVQFDVDANIGVGLSVTKYQGSDEALVLNPLQKWLLPTP